MFFIRFAGCNVGKYINLPGVAHSICTSALGEKFICDTDYHRKVSFNREQMLAMLDDCPEKRFCLTGGEPLMHAACVREVIAYASSRLKAVHIETSGTLPLSDLNEYLAHAWITCSPKQGVLVVENRPHISEWKFVLRPSQLVNSITKDQIKAIVAGSLAPVYIQVIAELPTEAPDLDVYPLAAEFLRDTTNWYLSAQLHKFIQLR